MALLRTCCRHLTTCPPAEGASVVHRRRGFSLIEMVFVLALFSGLMAALLGSLGGVGAFVDQEEATNDLALEGRKVVEQMVKDLGNSAWYIPIDLDGDGGARAPIGTDVNDLDVLLNAGLDRKLRYYPYIQVQSDTGRGERFTAHHRLASAVVDPVSLPPTLPLSHRASSQEVIFLKVRTAPTAASPAALAPARINFNTEPLTAAVFSATRAGVASDSMLATTSGGVVNDVPLAWESHLAAPDNTNPDDLREYSYVVVPNAKGKGQLERRYRNGTGAVVTDQVLSLNIDRLVVDTYRTATGLNVNQVRITVYLSKEYREQPGLFQTQRVEVTAALRSTVDPEYSLNLGDWLGGAGAFNVN